MKFHLFVLFTFALLLHSMVLSEDNFTFDADYSYFRAEDNKLYLELYYAFNQEELSLIKTADGYEVKGRIMLDLYSNSAGKNIIMKDFYIPMQIKDTSGYERHSKLTGQINFLLDTGTYKLQLKACDFYDSSKCVSRTEDLVLGLIARSSVGSSSIQLSSNIVKSKDENNIFYKNTLEVTPNPSKLFGNNLSKLYYYVELYNLKKDLVSESYSVNIKVVDTDGKEIKSDNRKYSIMTDSKVEYGALDIGDIPSGKYYLYLHIVNDKGTEVLKTFKEFWILNSNVVQDINPNSTDIEKKYITSNYPKMSEKQVEDEFEKSIYLMTDKNREVYKSLNTLDKKKLFMFTFWNALDPNPATIESEFRTDYMSRISFANKNFGQDFREGWQTDRGRIYALYGKYDEIERHSYEGATRAYEIWTYNTLQSGVIFVFIDESAGYGNFVLVHSTAQHEIFDENWRDKLRIK